MNTPLNSPAAACRDGRREEPMTVGKLTAIHSLLTALAATVVVYLLWADHRIDYMFDPPTILRPVLPDLWLTQLHDWYDRRNPTPTDMIKICGEVYRVRAAVRSTLGCSSLITIFLAVSRFRRTLSRTGSGGQLQFGLQFSLLSFMQTIAVVSSMSWAATWLWHRHWEFRVLEAYGVAIVYGAIGGLAAILLFNRPTLGRNA